MPDADVTAEQQTAAPTLVLAIDGVNRSAAVVILLLAAGSLATQAFAISTGRDHLFGLVPKLNAAGPRSIPVWFASAAVMTFGAAALLTGASLGAARRRLAAGWSWLAAALVLLSADRLAPLGRSLYFLVGDVDPHIAGAMASGVTAFAALAFYARCVASLPRIGRFHFVTPAATFALGVGVCAMGSAGVLSSPDDLLAQALILSAGRILELSGLTLALGELIAHARARSSRMFLHIDNAAPRVLAARHDGDRLDVTVSPLAIARIIALIVTLLLAVSFVTAVGRTLLGWDIERCYRLFFVDFEGNLPTWFSSVLLFSSGAVLAAIAATSRDRGDRRWRYWGLLAALLVALSADEAASFHEMTVYPLRSLLGGNPWLRYPLIIPGSIAAAATVVMFRGFMSTLPAATSRGLCAGAGLFLFGAIGIETVAGWFDPVVHGDNLPYILLATFEEACEFAGAAMVLHALLRHVEMALAPMEISVRP